MCVKDTNLENRQSNWAKPNLNNEQKRRIKKLYKYSDFRPILGLLYDYMMISISALISLEISFLFYPISIILIASRQRALASLFHDAAHGTLFASKFLNIWAGRMFCGWLIFQSFDAYKTSHVKLHHKQIGDVKKDPDYIHMKNSGVYTESNKIRFLFRYFILPAVGSMSKSYINLLINDRFIKGFHKQNNNKIDLMGILTFHFFASAIFIYTEIIYIIVLFWWIPLLIVHPAIGWWIELSEHFPMMEKTNNERIFYSRNRYPSKLEKFILSIHNDNYHLTHHLFPGIPYWNLGKATSILREDPEFYKWDSKWGGIFTSSKPHQCSLIKYVWKEHDFDTNDPLIGRA